MKSAISYGLIAISIAFLVSGCVEWNTVKNAIAINGAIAADEARAATRGKYCKVDTIGAVMRELGNNPKKMRAWLILCDYAHQDGAVHLIKEK